MKQWIPLLLIIVFPAVPLSAGKDEDASMKLAKKEAQELAKKQQENLFFKKSDLGILEDDLLSETDKGKTFEADSVKEKIKHERIAMEQSECKEFLRSASKKERFEGTEEIFLPGALVVENPQRAVGISSEQQREIPEEKKLEICQEAGTYQVSFVQKRVIQVIPERKGQQKLCTGHKKTDSFFWEKDAKKKVKSKLKEMSKDQTLASYEAYIDTGSLMHDYVVVIKWQHKPNPSKCDRSRIEETVVEPGSESESWDTDFPQGLSDLESNPHCKLLYSRVLEGPETRTIQGKAVFRECWAKQVFFSCEPNQESKCVKLRELGGVLTHKKCLKENAFEECDLWQKTYDLGKRGAYQQKSIAFEDQKIWGLDEFEPAYDKNTDLPQVATTLAIFSDLKTNLEETGTDFREEDAEVFKGESLKCKRSFLQGGLFDCCKKMEGLAVDAHLARCTSEEKCLAKQRQEGKCHYIGSRKEKLGTETSQVFCCFPTKLARVVHEQGREQLGISWGNSDKPKCDGLSIKELQEIDFSKIDLGEVLEDLKVDAEEVSKKVKATIVQLQSEGSGSAKTETETRTRKQFDEMRN